MTSEMIFSGLACKGSMLLTVGVTTDELPGAAEEMPPELLEHVSVCHECLTASISGMSGSPFCMERPDRALESGPTFWSWTERLLL